MALCRRGSFLIRSTATIAAAPCEPLLAAATSLDTGGGLGRFSRAKHSDWSRRRRGQPRGMATVGRFFATETNRLLFLSRLAQQDDLFVLVHCPAGMHAFGRKRSYSSVPVAPTAATFQVSLESCISGVSQTTSHSLPAEYPITVPGRPHASGLRMDVNSCSAARWAPGILPVTLSGLRGNTQGPHQHGMNRKGFASHQQARGFAFPSLRFFVNSGMPSGETAPEAFNRSSSGAPVNSRVSPQQLQMLQQQAEANLDDAQVQQRYLAALNAHGESYRAVEHVEKYGDQLRGMSEAVLIEYVKALCSSGLIHLQGRSISQVVNKYLAGGGRLAGGSYSSEATRDAPTGSSLSSLLQQHQSQQQQLLQQQLTVQLQQLIHQLQVDGVHRRTASFTSPVSDAAAEGEIVKLANAATAAGRLSVSAAAPLSGWRKYSPIRAIKWFCRAFWGLLKACNFLNDGVQAMQNSVKSMEGNGGLGNQTGGKKASDWVSGKVVKPEEVNTSFADVKGCEEVKKEVVEVVEYLKAPAKFTAMGARLPKGVLLQGPPGTGKTLLARAIAGEAGVPFIHASGSDFEEMYVGVGASRLRQLFAEARKRSPCILFIDEIDALGGRRTLTENKHHRQTLNQLLTELDGFKPSDGVTLICATNLAEALDPALTRPGRIDRIIHVPLPCKKERVDILQHYAVKMPLAEDVDLDLLASLTSGMTGADLANLLNFAAIRAATEGKSQVTLAEVEESFDRLMVGNRRSSVVMKEEERKVTAYHESGHALMCLYTPGSLPLHKATILFRGSALGVTWSVNKEESFSKSLKEYLASLDVAMGGKAAEEIVFGNGNVTSGCFNDLQKATRVARDMVTGFGMGVEDSKAPMVISGKEYSFLSDESKKKVDEAVQRLLDQSYDRARTLLTEKRDELERLAQALLEHETLTAEEIRAAVAGTIDSGAIRERRKQKASATRALTQKVNGDEGEGEELLRTGGTTSESSVHSKNSEDSHVEFQANDDVSSEVTAGYSQASASLSSVDRNRSAANAPATASQDAFWTSRGSEDGSPRDTEARIAGRRLLSSDAPAPYAVAGSATVAAMSALLAAATHDQLSEQEKAKQQQPVGKASPEEASSGGACRTENTVQEQNTGIMVEPMCAHDRERCVTQAPVNVRLDASDTEMQRFNGPTAGGGKEGDERGGPTAGGGKEGDERGGRETPESQHKTKRGDDLMEEKRANNSSGEEHDRTGESPS